jgi:hypothetical protein
MAAQIEGDFVVFLIGMRINKPWKLHKWVPIARAMPRMIKELEQRPESGFLGAEFGSKIIVQYWRSFEHLEAYARSTDGLHWPAWVALNKRIADSREDVGIWHETYLIRAQEYEAIYSGMPPFGLGKVGTLVPADGRLDTARGRIRHSQESNSYCHQRDSSRWALNRLDSDSASDRSPTRTSSAARDAVRT